MNLSGKVVVVTGGAHGIGRALCRRFAAEGADVVVVADLDLQAAKDVAELVQGRAVVCDVARQADVTSLVSNVDQEFGRIDLFCANAGIARNGGVDLSDDVWQEVMQVNFMSHVHAARAVLPGMLRRGGGYLLHTSSAAGLLTVTGSAPYAVSKHAVVALAEWLSITHGERGIGVSCLCPMGVQTRMLAGESAGIRLLREGSVTPEQVADAVIEGLAEERFLILPHPEVAEFFRRKADDYPHWLAAMRHLHGRLADEVGEVHSETEETAP